MLVSTQSIREIGEVELFTKAAPEKDLVHHYKEDCG